MLLQAYVLATDAETSRWDFAVEIENLRNEGMDETAFRWLVCKGYVEHAEEITLPGESGRTFRSTGDLTFTPESCFTLTDAGAEYMQQALLEYQPRCSHCGDSRQANAAQSEFGRKTPCWDAERHELKFADFLVKRFKHSSPNQEMILAVFQEEGWPARIQDPLPPNGDTTPKRRLNDTIKGLNHHQDRQLIRFRGDGTGEGIIWEYVPPEETS
jgi:hypothetical protein